MEHARAPNRAFVSYGSPIVIFLGFYALLSQRSAFQTLLLGMWVVHFAKRLLETRYVHLYSPGKNMHGCFSSNAFVFYIVFAFWIGFSVFNKSYVDRQGQTLFVILYFVSIVGNFIHHYKLRLLKLEMDRTRKRTFPNGLLFELVACPHYTFECMTWFFFAVVSNTLASWCFFVATVALLLRWSKERYDNYKKMEGYPAHRTALIPYLY
jgi:very-long-chain enoyl-CoA reductase